MDQRRIRHGACIALAALVMLVGGTRVTRVSADPQPIHLVALGDSLAQMDTLVGYGYVKSYREDVQARLGVSIGEHNFGDTGKGSIDLRSKLTVGYQNDLGEDLFTELARADYVVWDIGLNDLGNQRNYYLDSGPGNPFPQCYHDPGCIDLMIGQFNGNWDAIISRLKALTPVLEKPVTFRTIDVHYPLEWGQEDTPAETALFRSHLDQMNAHIRATTGAETGDFGLGEAHFFFNGANGKEPALHLGVDGIHYDPSGAAQVGALMDACPTFGGVAPVSHDHNFISLPHPRYSFDDITRPNSDNVVDGCDADDDNDGLSDSAEAAGCNGHPPTDALVADSDGDEILDGAECGFGSDPMDPASKPAFPSPADDPDGDRLSTAFEISIGTDPNNADTDGDGLKDGMEYKSYGTDPLAANTDLDACSDLKEVANVDGNTAANANDLAIIAEQFNQAIPVATADFDVDKNGTINAADLALVASQVPSYCT